MKAQERHRLKTNELDMKLTELLEYVSGPGKKYLVGGIIVLLALIAGSLMFSNFKSARQNQSWLLQSYLQGRQIAWNNAVQQARLGPAGAAEQIDSPYTTEELAESLEKLSSQAKGTAVGMTALLQSAETLRSRLYMEPKDISETQKQEICTSAEQLYNQVLSQYSTHPLAVGAAQLGLAIVAEDRGDWEKARRLYQKIADDADGKLAFTAFPAQANRRLKLLDDIDVEINFAAAPVETPIVETPAVETPAVETPAVESPAVESPAVETPAVETPAVPLEEKPAPKTPAISIKKIPAGKADAQPEKQ
ncbi:MAG: hypothetical protein JXD22_08430 [Sedimentisphaerales bacterium]|nr:hypothetical protein [Sedimentisphaerales bacterium]